MAGSNNPFIRFLRGLLTIFRVFRSIVLNLLFLFLVLVIFGALVGQPPLVIPQGAALVLNPNGVIVEQTSYVNVFDQALNDAAGASANGEVLLQDLLDAIELAAADARISSILLSTDSLLGAGLSHLQDIGRALQEFRASGKKIYAIGGNYSQAQYHLASQADVIMLNNYGSVGLEGLSAWQNYFGEALQKLGVNVHIFRVGEYKSAVEPFERNDMSPEAEANYSRLLGELWRLYSGDIAARRNVPAGRIDDLINRHDVYLAQYGGDEAQLALQNGLVDRVETRAESEAFLIGELGSHEDSFPAVDFLSYLAAQRGPTLPATGNNQVGIIVASGTITDGEAPRGTIGGDTLAMLVRQARQDDNIRALVLRIDSGGGSAFASEIIRAELAAFKASGRPIVVSMGNVAASGGYWIATPADQIWASPATITGSIGIFGLYPTFENTFAKLGIGTDGVSTSELAGFATPGRPLTPMVERTLQLTVEHGYQRFIDLVSVSRAMPPAAVDQVAQGQIWSGQTALANRLVDQLGSLEQAIEAAATLADLDDHEATLIEIPRSPAEQLLEQLTRNAALRPLIGLAAALREPSPLDVLMSGFDRELGALFRFNDPDALYLQCLECGSPLF